MTFANFVALNRLSQRRGQRLAVQSLQLRLVIERIDLRRPADHEQEDHRLGPRREMRRPRRERLQRIDHRRLARRGGPQLLAQQCLERQRAETGPKLAKEPPSRTIAINVRHCEAKQRNCGGSRNLQYTIWPSMAKLAARGPIDDLGSNWTRRKTMLRSIAAVAIALLAVSKAWGLGIESFGNEPLTHHNYVDWPNVLPVINDSHRVYHVWVNGNESFYFEGDTTALNVALKNFATIKADRLTVVLRPGPGKGSSLKGDQLFGFDWDLHLLGGISKHLSTLELGSNVWDPNPQLYVYIGEAIKLDEIEIPEGVELLQIADLQTRYAKCLASKDDTVRGWCCGHIARLDPYNSDSMEQVARKLDDDDDWVKSNAVGAMSLFTGVAGQAIEKLKAVKTDNAQLQEQIQKSIERLQQARLDEASRKEHELALESIHAFVSVLRQSK